MSVRLAHILVPLLITLISPVCLEAQTLVGKKSSQVGQRSSMVSKENSSVGKPSSTVSKESSLVSKESSLVSKENSLANGADAIGSHSIVVSQPIGNVVADVTSDVISITQTDASLNGYGKFLKIVSSADPEAKSRFVSYVHDWQWSGQKEGFLEYAAERAEREKNIALCYDKAIQKFGIGTALIATAWTVTMFLPGGPVVTQVVLVIAKAATMEAISGIAFGGVMSGGISLLRGDSFDEVVCETINGAADGYMWGAMGGIAGGTVKFALTTPVGRSISQACVQVGNHLYDVSGELLVDLKGPAKEYAGRVATLVENYGKEAAKSLSPIVEKGSKSVRIAVGWIESKGSAGIDDILKWKGTIPEWAQVPEIFEMAKNMVGSHAAVETGAVNVAKLFKKYGNDVIKALSQAGGDISGNLGAAINWIDARGIDGVYDLLKWKGIVPEWARNPGVVETARKISGSTIKASMDAMKDLPGIRLTTAQMDRIRRNPRFLRELVEQYTGQSFRDGYQEFFIRMAKQSPNQVEQIWNYSGAVRTFIKDNGIRAGGVHEWLMCENFMDFLLDPKWRDNGPYLLKIQTILTQKSENVYLILEDGTRKAHTDNFWKIHDLIRDVMNKSNSAEELLYNLDRMVYENYPEEVYRDFSKAYARCFE